MKKPALLDSTLWLFSFEGLFTFGAFNDGNAGLTYGRVLSLF